MVEYHMLITHNPISFDQRKSQMLKDYGPCSLLNKTNGDKAQFGMLQLRWAGEKRYQREQDDLALLLFVMVFCFCYLYMYHGDDLNKQTTILLNHFIPVHSNLLFGQYRQHQQEGSGVRIFHIQVSRSFPLHV